MKPSKRTAGIFVFWLALVTIPFWLAWACQIKSTQQSQGEEAAFEETSERARSYATHVLEYSKTHTFPLTEEALREIEAGPHEPALYSFEASENSAELIARFHQYYDAPRIGGGVAYRCFTIRFTNLSSTDPQVDITAHGMDVSCSDIATQSNTT